MAAMPESSCRELAFECLELAGRAADERFRQYYQRLAMIGLSLAAAELEIKRGQDALKRAAVIVWQAL